jgi:hypothetical protein
MQQLFVALLTVGGSHQRTRTTSWCCRRWIIRLGVSKGQQLLLLLLL